MAAVRANPRLQVGSASWIAEERASALQIAEAEAEEFTFSARNEIDWLNEHMAEIFSKNQVNVAEIFKTPGKLRGKTPRTARKNNTLEVRAPLSDVFSATPRGGPSPFRQTKLDRPIATFKVAEDEPGQAEEPVASNEANTQNPSQPKPGPGSVFFDSGYHGSQQYDATQATQPTTQLASLKLPTFQTKNDSAEPITVEDSPVIDQESEERRGTEESFQSAKEEQTRNLTTDIAASETELANLNHELEQTSRPVLKSPLQNRKQQPESPQKRSPQRPAFAAQPPPKVNQSAVELIPAHEEEHPEEVQSPSEGSSPLRPIVRKSSLNFASLPAREPLTNKKSIGNRVSRTSQLEQSRTSYYGRQTGSKSLGNARQDDIDGDDDDMDLDGPETVRDDTDSRMMRLHNKTSTQRLQDQISMLGQSQSNVRPPSKSIASKEVVSSHAIQASHGPVSPKATRQKSPQRKERPTMPRGAFPEDEDDSWIGPPTAAPADPSIFSPRPQMTKSYSTDVMEDIRGKDSIGGSQFNLPKQRGNDQRQRSPLREPAIPERTTSTLSHIKSVSTSVLRSPKKAGDSPGNKKGISVSNPNPSIGTNDAEPSTTPPKSPSRSYRGSPLKAAKDKFSSILKTSRGLFASSAAVSAEAKSSTMSPAISRLGVNHAPSLESLLESDTNTHAPSFTGTEISSNSHQQRLPDSPSKPSARKTRASTEREEKRKEEKAREAKETKEAQKMERELEKARQKVQEEARVYHLEQERVAAMQKQVQARKEQERLAKASQVEAPRATRSSPRKTKAQLEAEGIAAAAASADDLSNRDVEMSDVSAMPPPARPKSQIGRPAAKRPLKPAKEPLTKAKPPTVIRVDTGSQRGHQYHPSNSTLAASLQDSLPATGPSAPQQGHLRNKASTSSIQSKASTSSFKSQATKALEAAARKKEQDELAAQRKRDAKLEVERQRAAIKEEERRKEEQVRRQEAERQRQVQREREQAAAAADAKKSASRQAIEKRRLEMEKAKETRAPPPAVRPQPSNGDLSLSVTQEKALPPVPAQRDLGQAKAPRMNSTNHRPQEDLGRSINAALQNTAKVPPKRPLQQDVDDHHSRPILQRNGPSYQQNEPHTKRHKTSEGFDDDDDMTETQPKMTAPPIRNSSVRQKEMPTKSLFPSGYAHAPPPATNLQRSTVISQHNMSQSKPAHPMDMAQVSKAPIPFATSSSQANVQSYKTPARPGTAQNGGKSTAKSAAKSSPRYQNGENIDLPEIHTDSEDEDSDADNGFVALGWTNSPDLRKQLAKQETIDPAEVFGQPGPLNMEEVFSKSKDRWHKFRARTSSANWTGQDRLTEDEIRKDLEARDRVRRQGGWTYDSMV